MKKYFLTSVFVFVLILSFSFTHIVEAGTTCTVQQFKFVPSTSTTSRFIAAANGGASDATQANFQMSSNCDIEITELKFGVNTGYIIKKNWYSSTQNPMPDSVTSIKVQDGSGSYISAKTTNISNTPSTSTGSVDVTGLSIKATSFNLANLNTLLSYVSVGNINTFKGINSGATSQVSLNYVKFKDTKTGTVYTFCASGCTLKNTKVLTSSEMTLVGSYPDVTITNVTNKLSVGLSEIANVTFTNNGKSSVLVQVLPFKLIYKNVATNQFKNSYFKYPINNIVVKDTSGTVIPTEITNSMQGSTDRALNFIGFLDFSTKPVATNDLNLSAGQSKTVKVFLDVAKLGSSGTSSVNVNFGSPKGYFSWLDFGMDGYVLSDIHVWGGSTNSWGTNHLPKYPTSNQTITN